MGDFFGSVWWLVVSLGLLVTFPGTIPSMTPEFPAGITVVPKVAEGALAALDAGDVATHDRLAAEAAKDLADCDTIALGQFSLARAKALVEAALRDGYVPTEGTTITRILPPTSRFRRSVGDDGHDEKKRRVQAALAAYVERFRGLVPHPLQTSRQEDQ